MEPELGESSPKSHTMKREEELEWVESKCAKRIASVWRAQVDGAQWEEQKVRSREENVAESTPAHKMS